MSNNRDGICLMADILGFSHIINKLEDDDLDQRISEWVKLVQELTKTHNIKTFNLLSDTLFVHFPEPFDINTVISFGKDLLEKSTSKSIPLRGAITYGEILTGDFIYGKAVIQAHNLEINQKWIGITLAEDVPGIESCFNKDQLMKYAVPMKKGIVRILPVISWDVPNIIELTKCTNGPGLAEPDNSVTQNVLELLTNTSIFKTQRNFKIETGSDFSEAGYPASHFIEQMENIILEKKTVY